MFSSIILHMIFDILLTCQHFFIHTVKNLLHHSIKLCEKYQLFEKYTANALRYHSLIEFKAGSKKSPEPRNRVRPSGFEVEHLSIFSLSGYQPISLNTLWSCLSFPLYLTDCLENFIFPRKSRDIDRASARSLFGELK